MLHFRSFLAAGIAGKPAVCGSFLLSGSEK